MTGSIFFTTTWRPREKKQLDVAGIEPGVPLKPSFNLLANLFNLGKALPSHVVLHLMEFKDLSQKITIIYEDSKWLKSGPRPTTRTRWTWRPRSRSGGSEPRCWGPTRNGDSTAATTTTTTTVGCRRAATTTTWRPAQPWPSSDSSSSNDEPGRWSRQSCGGSSFLRHCRNHGLALDWIKLNSKLTTNHLTSDKLCMMFHLSEA